MEKVNPTEKKMLVIVDNVLFEREKNSLHVPFDLEDYFKGTQISLVSNGKISEKLWGKMKKQFSMKDS